MSKSNILSCDNLNENLKSIYLDNILFIIPSNIFLMDKDGVLLECSAQQAKSFNLPIEQIKGKNIFDIGKLLGWDDSIVQNIREHDVRIMASQQDEVFEEKIIADKQEKYFLTHKAPLYDKKKKVIGILGISIDITDRKKAEEELKIAKANAEAANEYKRQFMENMEHDLRTPTLGIAGYPKVLEDRTDNPEMKKGLQMLAEAGEKLLKMLNDIIHASHASAGKFPVCSKKIDLLKVVNDVIALERPTIIVKKLKLDFDYQPDVPQIILSDEHRITRILLNLLSNAVKFTKQGSIKVGLGVAKKIDDNHVVLKLTVEDTGMGIPEKLQATMYDRFVRGTPANQGIYQGTGLGLSIVKEFLEELGGKISVESKVDQGTTFTCLIPVELPEAKKSHFKILLIEKESTIIPIELHLLRSNLPEAQIELVKTEEDAIKLIMQNNYDLIFMGMDWYPHDSCRITRSIREITQLPIVTLTAHPLEEVEAVFRASGADEVLLFTDINKNISTIARELINKS